MPIVNIDWVEGRTVEQKSKIAEQVTETFTSVTGCSAQAITIIFTDHPKSDIAKGGKLLSD
jgi:4-oxalocrotonate tautomerase